MPVLLTHADIEESCRAAEPDMQFNAHFHNLPYIPLIPSLRAHALLYCDWPQFASEYRRAIVKAIHSGQNFAYID